MQNLLLNAFSHNMLGKNALVKFEEVSLEEAVAFANGGFTSAVGLPDAARVFGSLLGVEVATNRVNVSLNAGDIALVGVVKGPRLPEGATSLPPGATIVWSRVTVLQ